MSESSRSQLDLAVSLHNAGKLEEARAIYERILQQNPDHSDALYLSGVLDTRSGQPDLAMTRIRKAIQLQPRIAEYYTAQANAFLQLGQADAAIESAQTAILLKPASAEAYACIGLAYQNRAMYAEAVGPYEQALHLQPSLKPIYQNLSAALENLGSYAEAEKCLLEGLSVDPQSPELHTNLAMIRLRNGDFKNAWPEYEWRLKLRNAPLPDKPFAQPRWRGEHFAGKTLLIYFEQGYGDAIQFIRYIPRVAERGGTVWLVVLKELVRLFEGFPGIARVWEPGDVPPFHLQCPLLNLAYIFGTDANNIPAAESYLRADPSLLEKWHRLTHEALASKGLDKPAKKIGICWSGRPTHASDRTRSIDPSLLAPLANAGNAVFLSLQKHGPDRANQAPPLDRWIDVTDSLTDFAETAALISCLDLVVTVDTAVAHLAGALGKPTWLMLAYVPDWRWMLNRADSPWYPSLRLYRQPRLGDWKSVIDRVFYDLGR